MYKYDIPYPKPGQLVLQVGEMPINVSKKKSYLIAKMKAHRDMMYNVEGVGSVEYRIVDSNGAIVYSYTFAPGEKGKAKEPYFTEKKDTVNYVERNGFQLIADDKGNILTDERLLKYLYDLRFVSHIPVMITNTALVSMATYKPKTEVEFVSLKGLGQGTYNKCGKLFIDAIQNYLSKNDIREI